VQVSCHKPAVPEGFYFRNLLHKALVSLSFASRWEEKYSCKMCRFGTQRVWLRRRSEFGSCSTPSIGLRRDPRADKAPPTAAPEFLPEAKHPISGLTASIKENSYHRWLKGLSAEQRQKIRELYQQLYEQPPE
jgi:hypothetical protein